MIEHAGFIVTNNEAIWGFGPTADAAWQDFLNGMASARVRVVDEPTEADLDDGANWTREGDYTIRSASAALLRKVETHGGAIAWSHRNGVCCTREEEEGVEA